MIAEHAHYAALARRHPRFLSIERALVVETRNGEEAIHVFHLGDREADLSGAPALGLFAGVHGIEFVGVRILLSFVESLLGRVRIVGIPIVNPAGFVSQSRSNGRGVDFMRNAPVESASRIRFFGGQSLSSRLPYFRGFGAFEAESALLVDLVRKTLREAPFSLALDLHSGFGLHDFLWTPYARQPGLPPTWPEYLRLKEVLDGSLPHHKYHLEPQSAFYCASGDLWDYLYDEYLDQEESAPGRFLPLTLEIGALRFDKKVPSHGPPPLELLQPGPSPPLQAPHKKTRPPPHAPGPRRGRLAERLRGGGRGG